jgi:opacity protein-like surface antigen
MFGDLTMTRFLIPAAAAALLAASALSAAAQPTPKEQVGMHVGDTTTNGSAVIVSDRNGTHPEGYPGMAVRNRIAADGGGMHRRHHHRRHHSADDQQYR